ncbi:FliA/WhiG family RNA polymerase sigma factor [Anaerosinus gibii]|uniref:RNA polymerase sigma factor n=1 Tax=Selenobaculum gibii TaxID=3054208 RepID=A0A9Y2AK51_9FIRM|nr:FliA/WhiG family RNA polymerase sigma factor [Selenobaculum gbiensis]WIW71606.1 FliA/WhiG family RNA polymerase sigma factor [Selenobaculum gbiensis]
MSNNQEYDIQELWIAYQEKKSPIIREHIVNHYLSLVNLIAGRIAISLPAYVDRDDLISCGFFGLLDAIERYDPVRGNKFETYAGVRIRGAILDSLRAKDWLPVSLRQKIRKYEKTVEELEGKLGRAATDKEIVDALKISIQDLNSLLNQLNIATIIPLETYVKNETAQDSIDGPAKQFEIKEVQENLAKAIDKLPEKEKLVISLYYYEELTLKEISLILKLSEARISQLHTKAVFRLRGYLARNKMSFIE